MNHGEISGNTVWNGSAFSGCNNNEITLPHNRFEKPEGAFGMCNKGAITGQSVNMTIVNDYVSQLIVIVKPGMMGKDIKCFRDDGKSAKLVGSRKLNISTSIFCTHTSPSGYSSMNTRVYMNTISGT